jgi:fumarate reductase flavoprotein subunit
MSRILSSEGVRFEAAADLVIVGAGAAGLVAALAAKEAGAAPLLIERDRLPAGSTALSAGLIPAAGTRVQQRQGIADSVEAFRRDILAKSKGLSDATVLEVALGEVGPAIDWLEQRYGLPFEVIADFRYPGHSALRMHALPGRTGQALVDRLRAAAERKDIAIITEATATTLFTGAGGLIDGVEIARPGGARERIGCGALVLACNGYGGSKELVARYIPGMADAFWAGHSGNQGDAVLWGAALGAELRHMGGHQGHGSVAVPHGILITWATIMEGGFQVNARGLRFSDESKGYSEQGAVVLAEEGGVAWSIFDARIAGIARQFEDFRVAEARGAVLAAGDVSGLAAVAGLPEAALAVTFAEVELSKGSGVRDAFGRNWAGVAQLTPPLHAVKVTGALLHTQGGLAIDTRTRVRLAAGGATLNLFAAGGAAVGVSGPAAAGYLSGNGLLTAVGLGRVAGREAARAAAPG